MNSLDKTVRLNISLPWHLASEVRKLAKDQRTSIDRVLVGLIQTGIESKENHWRTLLDLADQLTISSHPGERKRVKKELARLTFGE